MTFNGEYSAAISVCPVDEHFQLTEQPVRKHHDQDDIVQQAMDRVRIAHRVSLRGRLILDLARINIVRVIIRARPRPVGISGPL